MSEIAGGGWGEAPWGEGNPGPQSQTQQVPQGALRDSLSPEPGPAHTLPQPGPARPSPPCPSPHRQVRTPSWTPILLPLPRTTSPPTRLAPDAPSRPRTP